MKVFEKMRRVLGRRPESEPASLYQEMEVGAVMGFFACTVLAFLLAPGQGPSAGLALLACLLGLFTGAVIGAVLWIGSARLPEDAVRAPGPGQGRSDRGGRR